MRKIAAAMVPLVLAISACADPANYLSFTPPRIDPKVTDTDLALCQTKPSDTPNVVNCANTLRMKYDQIADDLANGQQVLDLPVIGLASAALSATAFNKKPELVKRSAVAIATIAGLRTYYNADNRRSSLLQASAALRCVYDASSEFKVLDATRQRRWDAAYANSAILPQDVSASIQKYDRLVRNVPDQVYAAIEAIEIKLEVKLASPAAPVTANMATSYSALAKQWVQNQQDASSAGDAGASAGGSASASAESASSALQGLLAQYAAPSQSLSVNGIATPEQTMSLSAMSAVMQMQSQEIQRQKDIQDASDLLLDKAFLEDLGNLGDSLNTCKNMVS